jgi:hypothetical protein
MDLGAAVQQVLVEEDLIVAILIAQYHRMNLNGVMPIRFGVICNGTKKIAKVAKDWNASVHMNRIGSGFANENRMLSASSHQSC